MNSVAELCPNCGLCCNGVLFGDVELRRGDDPKTLAALGVPLAPKGGKLSFPQPCSCFDGKWCGIYPNRPVRCRTFECRLLKRLDEGKVPAKTALKTVQETRSQAETVRSLVRRLGQTDESLPLNRRYARIMAEPLDLADGEARIELRAELMLAVHNLTQQLEQEFLV